MTSDLVWYLGHSLQFFVGSTGDHLLVAIDQLTDSDHGLDIVMDVLGKSVLELHFGKGAQDHWPIEHSVDLLHTSLHLVNDYLQ